LESLSRSPVDAADAATHGDWPRNAIETMKLPDIPFTAVALHEAEAVAESGETGRSLSRTFERAGVRLRLVEYQPGYLADHWCDRGHVFHLLSGEVTVELKDGRAFRLTAGRAFIVADHGDAPHRVKSETGGVAFIVD
jgi:quercetin dioxygenase-like cupin family protein